MAQAQPVTVPGGGRGRPVLHPPLTRPALAWAAGAAGLLAYNWWVLVLFRPGLMRSPNELFSNLEVSGQVSATAMQHADLVAGLLLLGAFLAAGARSIQGGRTEWLAMMAFATAGALGGMFPEICGDEVSAACRDKEFSFQLPLQQYVHLAAGICEFGGITIALILAFRRTRGGQQASARVYRALIMGAVAAYPLLGLAYLLDRLGGVMEVIFFVGFTVMVVTQLSERTHSLRHMRTQPVPASPGAEAT
jgi:Protein of unknown function (DUF998)